MSKSKNSYVVGQLGWKPSCLATIMAMLWFLSRDLNSLAVICGAGTLATLYSGLILSSPRFSPNHPIHRLSVVAMTVVLLYGQYLALVAFGEGIMASAADADMLLVFIVLCVGVIFDLTLVGLILLPSNLLYRLIKRYFRHEQGQTRANEKPAI